MDREQIKRLALDSGFKLKTQADGSEDLNEYVYAFAAALLGCRPVVKDKLPLKPLKWMPYVHIEETFSNEVCRTKTLSHEYVVRIRTDLMYYVDYRRFDTDDDNARKDEPPEFETCKAAAEWVEHTHYPHTMRDWVCSLEEIKKELVK